MAPLTPAGRPPEEEAGERPSGYTSGGSSQAGPRGVSPSPGPDPLLAQQVDCWACGTRVQVPVVDGQLAPDFKCGWCGAITQRQRAVASKASKKKASACCKQIGSLCGWLEKAFDNSFCGAVMWCFQWITVAIVLALITSILVLGVTFVLPRLRWWPLHWLLAIVFSFNIYFNYFMTVKMSPGSPQEIPGFMSLKNWRPRKDKSNGHSGNAHAAEETKTLAGAWDEAPRGAFDNYTLCRHCEDMKPPQAHHCRVCNRCVLEMDHHCPFVNNCIGTSNLRHFMLFLLYAAVGCFYTMTAGIWSLWYDRAIFSGRSRRYPVSSQFFGGWMMTLVDMIAEAVVNPNKRWIIAVLYVTFVSFGVALGVGVLFSMQLQQLLAGVSYIDSLKGGGQIGCQASTSRMQNLQKVFGTGHLATWLLPCMSCPAGAASLLHVIKKGD